MMQEVLILLLALRKSMRKCDGESRCGANSKKIKSAFISLFTG
jgi:hypothetical protein